MKCLLCHTDADSYVLKTFECPNCRLIFKNPEDFLSAKAESLRYSSHQNISTDQGYLDFLGKLVLPLKLFLPKKFKSLDFGCGPGPTLSLILEPLGGETFNYDPYFFSDDSLLINKGYDVVTSTEVVEHFKTPQADWELLVSQLKRGGVLAVMTQMYSKEIDFKKWWYKNDPTHIVFYQKQTFNYLADLYKMEILYNDNKSVIIFKIEGNL